MTHKILLILKKLIRDNLLGHIISNLRIFLVSMELFQLFCPFLYIKAPINQLAVNFVTTQKFSVSCFLRKSTTLLHLFVARVLQLASDNVSRFLLRSA